MPATYKQVKVVCLISVSEQIDYIIVLGKRL